jgi:nucleotide-binding universal stress UspA family protein
MLHQIMVPLDGSPLADLAIPTAAAIARRTGAELHLLAVHRPAAVTMFGAGMAVEVVGTYEELDRLGREELESHLRRTRLDVAAGGVTAHRVLLEGVGPVCEQLDAYADAHGIDLVVMTTHGRGAMGRFFMGSVADGLLRAGGRPCLLLRSATATEEAAPPTAEQAEAGFARVLVPLDGSLEAEHAIDGALDVVRPEAVELVLAQVVVPLPWLVPTLPPNGADWTGGAMLERERLAGEYLDALVARLGARGVRARALVRIHHSPPAAILDLLAAERIDLLAVSARRRGAADRLLLGSVIDKLVRHAPVPVLVARVPAARAPATVPSGSAEALACATS